MCYTQRKCLIAISNLNPASSPPFLSNSTNNRQRLAKLFIKSVFPILSLLFAFVRFSKFQAAHNNYLAKDWLLPLLCSYRFFSQNTNDDGLRHGFEPETLPMPYVFPFPHLCYLGPTDLYPRVLSRMVTLVETVDSISLLIWMSRPPTLPSKV